MRLKQKIRETNEFRVTDPRDPVRILRDSEDDFESFTIPELFEKTSSQYGDCDALVYKSGEKWVKINYKEYRESVVHLAKVFIKFGLERQGVVTILAGNCVQWPIAELATIYAGGVITGIYPTSSIEACSYILDSSKSQIVVAENEIQMEKIRRIRHKLPHLKIFIQINQPFADYFVQSDGYWKWYELLEVENDVNDEFERRLAEISINDCFCIVYTSGTTGPPKGALLSHDNFMFSILHNANHELERGKDRVMSYLPMANMASQIYEIMRPIAWAGSVYFGDSDAIRGSILDLFVEVQPTNFVGIPRIYEKLRDRIEVLKSECGLEIESPENILRIRKILGISKIKRFGSSTAPMDQETKQFLKRFQIEVMEGLGQTETTGIYCRCITEGFPENSVGYPIQGVSIKISNPDQLGNGEIYVKGRSVFMGYLNDVEKTFEAIDDNGWLHTGDIGRLGEDGMLFLTGRIKDLVITSGGKNVPAPFIERKVKTECSAISNVILIGDKRKFLTILITLKAELNPDGTSRDDLALESKNWLGNKNLKYNKVSEIIQADKNSEVQKAFEDVIAKVNKTALSNPEKIQKFTILSNDFSIVTGELTSNLKIKRHFVVEKYNKEIDKMYN